MHIQPIRPADIYSAQDIEDLLESLDGFGLVLTDESLIRDRLIELGFGDGEAIDGDGE